MPALTAGVSLPLDEGALEQAVRACAGELAGARAPLFVVPDRTRDACVATVLPRLVKALNAAGAPCLFASGTHAPMSEREQRAVLGAAEVSPIAHDCDASPMRALPSGARLNAALSGADAIVVVSEMRFHYLAGFGGGRKMLLPGCADRASATAVHAHSMVARARAPGCAPGVLEDNPLHRAIEARLAGLPPVAGVAIVRDERGVIDAEGGELWTHHARLARRFAAAQTVVVDAPLDALELSTGGDAHAVNLVQAHKALVAVAPILKPGARVLLRAACPRGLGHEHFLAWVTQDEDHQLDALEREFNIGRQTAWSLRTLLDRFEVAMITELDDDTVRALGARPLKEDEVSSFLGPDATTAPAGAALLYTLAEG